MQCFRAGEFTFRCVFSSCNSPLFNIVAAWEINTQVFFVDVFVCLCNAFVLLSLLVDVFGCLCNAFVLLPNSNL